MSATTAAPPLKEVSQCFIYRRTHHISYDNVIGRSTTLTPTKPECYLVVTTMSSS